MGDLDRTYVLILKIKNLKTANRDRTKSIETRITQADRLALTNLASSGIVCRNTLAHNIPLLTEFLDMLLDK